MDTASFLLLAVAFAGGMLTLLSPCILPVLPFVLARRGRPFRQGTLPLLAGMALAFAAVASLGAVAGAWAVRLNLLGRGLALGALALFALALLSPHVAQWLAAPLVRLGQRLSPPAGAGAGEGGGNGVFGALLLGVATGLVWSPCAGPILGLILSGAALAGPGVRSSALLLAYGLGAAMALGLVLRAGQGRQRAPRPAARRALGAAMLAGVVAVGTGLDTRVLARLPASWSGGLEAALLDALPMSSAAADTPAAARPAGTPSGLPVEATRAGFDGATGWFNGAPLDMAALRGKVVVVNFWTYSCINCLRTLPQLRDWSRRYADQGLVVVGVHTPEFAFEKDTDNLRRALRDLDIRYPVAQDNQQALWRAFGNQYWPALYFIDAQGRVRHHQFGEGGAARSEQVIQALLHEAGAQPQPQPQSQPQAAAAPVPDTRPTGLAPDAANLRTGETYLGWRQASGFASPERLAPDRRQAYSVRGLRSSQWGLRGEWTVGAEYARLDGADGSIALRFHARDAHLVLGVAPGQGPLAFQLTLDGREPGADHGADVDPRGRGMVDATRLYQLVRQRGPVDDRLVEIRFAAPGARAYAFTFG